MQALFTISYQTGFYGAADPKGGAFGSVVSMHELNPKIEITGGILEEECSSILTKYFRKTEIAT